ncbi:hypothetical protein LTS17_003436 [Exophiala oligosperma]
MNAQKRKKSRIRQALSCVSCRERKVRCDRLAPCSACQIRGRAQYCRYEDQNGLQINDTGLTPERERSRRVAHRFVIATPDSPFHAAAATTPVPLQSPRTKHVTIVDESARQGSLVDELSAPSSRLIWFLDAVAAGLKDTWHTEQLTSETIFLGWKSSASLFRCLGEQVPNGALSLPEGLTVESVFGLTNRTTLHPFGSLWSFAGNPSVAEILKALPGVESCMRSNFLPRRRLKGDMTKNSPTNEPNRYYRSFRQNLQTFYPLLLDPEGFERRLCDFMEKIGDSGIESALELASEERSFHDAAWYGLLFGVLACGCQFSGPESQDRVLKARVFVAGAFECLRLAHHYGIPTLATIQTSLMILFTIANDSNPGVASAVLASTSQQAQSLGLHVGGRGSQLAATTTIHPLWSMIMFFDYEFSSAFGRIPVVFLPNGDCDIDLPLEQQHHTSPVTFWEFTLDLLRLKQSWQTVRMRHESPADAEPEIVSRTLRQVAALEEAASRGRLTRSQQAGAIDMKVEQLMATIYVDSFRAEVLCCSSLSGSVDPALRQLHLDDMRGHLQQVLRALIALKQLSPTTVTTPWTLHHCVTSSALILAAFDCALGSTRDSRALLKRFILSYSSGIRGDNIMNNEDDLSSSTPYSDAVCALEYIIERAAGEEARRML